MKEATLAGGIIEITDLGPCGPRDGFAPRGQAPAFQGDITGAQARKLQKEKELSQGVIEQTAAFIRAGHDLTTVPTPGGRTWVLPTELYRWLTSKNYEAAR